jgi:hypothetical protein
MALLIRRVTPDLIADFIEFSKLEYKSGSAINLESIEWRHLNSPAGPSTSVQLHNDAQQIARIWVQSNYWRLGQHELRVASPIDLLIDPDFRKTQVFISIFNSGMKTALSEADLVIHTSNPLTDDLYRKLMKLSPITDLDGAFFPLRPIDLLSKKFDIALPKIFQIFDATFRWLVMLMTTVMKGDLRITSAPQNNIQERIIEDFHLSQSFASRRSAQDREWRYSGAGSFNYQIQWFKSGNLPIGYLVWSDREIDGIKGRFIIDIVFAENLSRYKQMILWSKAINIAIAEDLHALFFFYNSKCDTLRSLSRFPMMRVGRSLLPQQIPIFVRHGKDMPVIDADSIMSKGYFVLADLDMF